MAGDWTAIEHATPRKPALLKIAALSGRSRHETLGLMVEFWIWCETNTANGKVRMPFLCLPESVGADLEFWRAVVRANWIELPGGENSDHFIVPRANHWLTNGAKSRLTNTRRQKKRRASSATKARQRRDKSATTEEKRTEQKRRDSASAESPPNPPVVDLVDPGVPVPPELDGATFRSAWSEWFAFRRDQKKKPVTIAAAKAQLRTLAGFGPAVAVAAINRSIANDWQGIFPEREAERNGKGHKPGMFDGLKEFAASSPPEEMNP